MTDNYDKTDNATKNKMRITLDFPSSKLSPNARSHWAVLAKAKKHYRQDCYFNAMAQGGHTFALPEGCSHLRASFTFRPPSRRRYDIDNLVARMKSGIDGLVDLIKIDDSLWEMSFKMGDRARGGQVIVEIEGIA